MAIDAPPRIDAEPGSAARVEAFPPGYEDPRNSNTGLAWRRMSFEEYQQLPEKPKNEWFDGWAVIHVAAPTLSHSLITRRIFRQFDETLSDLEIFFETGFYVADKQFIPDVSAFDREILNRAVIDIPPVVAVEALSPSTRRYDLLTKADNYLTMGVRQYWTVDPETEEIVIRENAGDRWQVNAIIDAAHPTANISIGQYGDVTVNHADVFIAPAKRKEIGIT